MKAYVYIPVEIHKKLSVAATLLDQNLKEIAAEACIDWIERNEKRVAKAAADLQKKSA